MRAENSRIAPCYTRLPLRAMAIDQRPEPPQAKGPVTLTAVPDTRKSARHDPARKHLQAERPPDRLHRGVGLAAAWREDRPRRAERPPARPPSSASSPEEETPEEGQVSSIAAPPSAISARMSATWPPQAVAEADGWRRAGERRGGRARGAGGRAGGSRARDEMETLIARYGDVQGALEELEGWGLDGYALDGPRPRGAGGSASAPK